jgi:DNA-binding transcriptional LysR family regulator
VSLGVFDVKLAVRSARIAGFQPQIAFEAHDYQEAQAMVASGIGVALAPRLALAGIRLGVSVRRLEPPAPVRRILLTRMADHPTTPTAAAFTTILQTCVPLAEEMTPRPRHLVG